MTISKKAVKLFDVSGKYIVPGTREVSSFNGRIIAESMQKGSENLAKDLTEKHASKLKDHHRFSKDFALMNLQWKEFIAPPVVKEPDPIVDMPVEELVALIENNAS